MPDIFVSASFDHSNSRDFLFAEHAARLGPLHVLLWSDRTVQAVTGAGPKFPLAEREYLVQAMRFVDSVTVVDLDNPDVLPEVNGSGADTWVMHETEANHARRAFCAAKGIALHTLPANSLSDFPAPDLPGEESGRRKVVVTGCFDWFHSGHIAFFEEAAALGELYVVVGHDANIALLKGEGHPMFPEQERRYVVGSIRYVHRALVSSGQGWMDAEPEIALIRPDMYAVNEDGDKPEKREFCEKQGMEYVVLKRVPKSGLPRRESTHLRGF